MAGCSKGSGGGLLSKKIGGGPPLAFVLFAIVFIILLYNSCEDRKNENKLRTQMVSACNDAGGYYCGMANCFGLNLGLDMPPNGVCCNIPCGQRQNPACPTPGVCSSGLECNAGASCLEGKCYTIPDANVWCGSNQSGDSGNGSDAGRPRVYPTQVVNDSNATGFNETFISCASGQSCVSYNCGIPAGNKACSSEIVPVDSCPQGSCLSDSDCLYGGSCSDGLCYSVRSGSNCTLGAGGCYHTGEVCIGNTSCGIPIGNSSCVLTNATENATNQNGSSFGVITYPNDPFKVNAGLGDSDKSCAALSESHLCSAGEFCPGANDGSIQRMITNNPGEHCCKVNCQERLQDRGRVENYGYVTVEKVPLGFIVWYGDDLPVIGQTNYVEAIDMSNQWTSNLWQFTIPQRQLEEFIVLTSTDTQLDIDMMARFG